MLMLDNDPLPEPSIWPVKMAQIPDFRARLDANHPQRFGREWVEQGLACRDREVIRILRVHHGYFQSMGISDWDRFENVITLMAEDPEFVLRFMRMYGEETAQILKFALHKQNVDAAYFNEPIGGKNGPLISPEDYKKFALNNYKPVLDLLRDHNVTNIIFMSYSNVRKLLPMLIDSGFNCLWSCETDHPDMDYRSIRGEFGKNLRLIGGIDLKILEQDQKTMAHIIDETVTPLLAQGGYIPLANGRIRKNILPEKYILYRQLIYQAISESV
jgi:hypothetical protein